MPESQTLKLIAIALKITLKHYYFKNNKTLWEYFKKYGDIMYNTGIFYHFPGIFNENISDKRTLKHKRLSLIISKAVKTLF